VFLIQALSPKVIQLKSGEKGTTKRENESTILVIENEKEVMYVIIESRLNLNDNHRIER